MIAGTLVGPLLWRVNPAHQVLDQISQGPNLGMSALLVDDFVPWAGRTVTVPPARALLRRPIWRRRPRSPPTASRPPRRCASTGRRSPGATGYAIYRHELPPGGSFDLGLPLGEVEGAGTVSFEDRLGLESRRYFYSVVPLLDTRRGLPTSRWSSRFARQSRSPRRAIAGWSRSRMERADRAGNPPGSPIRSAPITSAAISSRASSRGRAPRCSSASPRRFSTCCSACVMAAFPATSAGASTMR